MSNITVKIDGQIFDVELGLVPVNGTGLDIRVKGKPVRIVVPNIGTSEDEIDWVIVDGRPYEISADLDFRWICSFHGLHKLEIHDAETLVSHPRSGDGRIKAPIPGQITLIMTEVGERVFAGEPLLTLEAMKMENHIRAPFDGVVRAIRVNPGQVVKLREVLVELE